MNGAHSRDFPVPDALKIGRVPDGDWNYTQAGALPPACIRQGALSPDARALAGRPAAAALRVTA
jgi:hypothetical protein